MKLSIDTDIDALYITFNDNKVAQTIQLELEINVDVDANNKVVGLEVLHYSKLKEWTNELLQADDLSLAKDAIVFYMHQGYNAAWFSLSDMNEYYTVCKIYLEGEQSIHFDLVQNFIQAEVDFIIKHR